MVREEMGRRLKSQGVSLFLLLGDSSHRGGKEQEHRSYMLCYKHRVCAIPWELPGYLLFTLSYFRVIFHLFPGINSLNISGTLAEGSDS